jgi:hypothetical protein
MTFALDWDPSKTTTSIGPHVLTAILEPDGTKVTSDPVVVTVTSAAPDVSAVSAATTTTTAVITWSTDVDSDSQVSYGATAQYGSKSPIADTSRTRTHSVTLTGLSPSTAYHYQVVSKDASGAPGQSADLTFNTKPQPPESVTQLMEGAQKINGYYSKTDKATKVRADVMVGENLVERKEQPVDDAGTFTVALDQPLSAEAHVNVYGENTDGAASEPLVANVTPSVLDWGRVRAYFTFGIVLASNQTNGSGASAAFSAANASPFLGFNVDKNWIRPARVGQWFRFNSFFDARLTAIGTTQISTSSPSAILANKQAGSLQVGAYMPIIITRWDFHNPNSLFFAPMVKTGFFTTSDTQTVGTLPNPTSFYKFYGYGVRIGHYREYMHWNGDLRQGRAPQQLSYIDFLVGKWANFEYVNPMKDNPANKLVCEVPVSNPGTTDDTRPDCFQRQRLWRFGFEGILQVPGTPFILGINANVAAQRPKTHNGFNFFAPPDDLRFLFGVRFDGKTLLAPLTKLGGAGANQ